MSTENLNTIGPELQVKSFWFYLSESGKVKINWFLYEFACKYYEQLMDSRNKTLVRWRSLRSKEQIAEFCAYFAKRMRLSVKYQLAGATKETEFDDFYASDYCHTNTQRENDAIIEVAQEAWLELLDTCSVCPCRCISERYEPCGFFDRMERE